MEPVHVANWGDYEAVDSCVVVDLEGDSCVPFAVLDPSRFDKSCADDVIWLTRENLLVLRDAINKALSI